jgi:hypothetical protein
VYDSPARGGTRTLAPQWMSPEAGLVRLNTTAANRAYTNYENRQQENRAAENAQYEQARAEGVTNIRRAQSTVGRLPLELQDVFSRMTPREKEGIVAMSPEGQYAALSSSPLRPVYRTPNMGGMATPGGIPDALNLHSSAPLFQSLGLSDETAAPVPTMRPLGAVKPTVSLPLPPMPQMVPARPKPVRLSPWGGS